jgi:hypothetical protein
MKTWLRLIGAGAFLLLLPALWGLGPNKTLPGTWKGSFEFDGKPVALTFRFALSGDLVTGAVEGLPTSPAEIHEGKLENDAVSFWVNTDYQGQPYKLLYKGTLSSAGDQIAFRMTTDDGSWGTELTATRSADETSPAAAADLSGDWTGAFEFNGGRVSLKLHLKSVAGVITGTIEGLPTTPTEIHEGKQDGDTFSFWVNTDYQGQTYKLVYKGTISAGQIRLSLGTDDGSWATQLTATKST